MKLMILAASGVVPIVINVLLVILVALSLLLCLVILMQRPKQEGLGAAFGGGMTDQAFGARTTDVLQKGTVWLGTLFFVITLAISLLVASQSEIKSTDSTLAEIEATKEVSEEAVTEVSEELATAPAEKVVEEAAPVEEVAPVVPVVEEKPEIEVVVEEAAAPAVEKVQEAVKEAAAPAVEEVQEAATTTPVVPEAPVSPATEEVTAEKPVQ